MKRLHILGTLTVLAGILLLVLLLQQPKSTEVALTLPTQQGNASIVYQESEVPAEQNEVAYEDTSGPDGEAIEADTIENSDDGVGIRVGGGSLFTTKEGEDLDACGVRRMAELESLPVWAKFEDYPVDEQFVQTPAALDLDSNFIARKFETNIAYAIETNSANFAGHYTVARFGFTGVGTMLAVVDATNGKAYPFPYVARGDFSYREDSNLIIMDPLDWWRERFEEDLGFLCMTPYVDHVSTWTDVEDSKKTVTERYWAVRPYYFVWENNKFKMLNPSTDPPPNDHDGGWLTP